MLTRRSDLFSFTWQSSATYRSRSMQRKRSGFRASTICTTSCERSSTRHSWRHTSRFFSNGVSIMPSPSSSVARPRRHSRNAARSSWSSASADCPATHAGRRGTGRSSSSGCAADAAAGSCTTPDARTTTSPRRAVKSVPARAAVLISSSRSPQSVTERSLCLPRSVSSTVSPPYSPTRAWLNCCFTSARPRLWPPRFDLPPPPFLWLVSFVGRSRCGMFVRLSLSRECVERLRVLFFACSWQRWTSPWPFWAAARARCGASLGQSAKTFPGTASRSAK